MDVFSKMLVLLGVKHTRLHASSTYKENPDRNNFLGLSEMFLDYNIQTICLRFKEIKLDEIPMPFIGSYNGDFCIVKDFTKDNKLKIFHRNSQKVLTIETFYKGWNGHAICITDISNACEKNYSQNFKKQTFKYLFFSTSILLISVNIIFAFANNIYLADILLLLLNIFGLYFSYLSININSKAKKSICKMFGESDCNPVLTSNASKLLGIFSLGEIGISFFMSSIFILLFFKNLHPALVYINTIALLVPIWSVLYQKFIAKSWCTICLLIQSLLIALFLVLMIYGMLDFKKITIFEIFQTLSVFIITFFIVYHFINFLDILRKYDKLNAELISIKSSQNIFDSLLKNQQYYNTKDSSTITFHEKDSDKELTIILNPYCSPCKLLHDKLDTLEKDGILNTYKLQLLFTAFTPEKENVIIAIIGYYYNHSYEETLTFIHNWYMDNNIELMMKYYNQYKDNSNVQKEFNNQKVWLTENKITGTPTVLYNGFIYPEEYDIIELKYLK